MPITDQVATARCTDPIQERFGLSRHSPLFPETFLTLSAISQ